MVTQKRQHSEKEGEIDTSYEHKLKNQTASRQDNTLSAWVDTASGYQSRSTKALEFPIKRGPLAVTPFRQVD